MRNLVFIITFLFALNVHSQNCLISIDQFFEVKDFNEVEFETFALENGFSYNSQEKIYECDKKYNASDHIDKYGLPYAVIFRGDENYIGYSFYDKQHYLNIKKSIPSKNFISSNDSDSSRTLTYSYEGKKIVLSTGTHPNIGYSDKVILYSIGL